MKTTHNKTKIPRSPVTRAASLAAAAPWRRSARLATLALGLAGIVPSAQATLQVYEPFNYDPALIASTTAGAVPIGTMISPSLDGQTGGTGFAEASSWYAAQTGTYPSGSPTGFAICTAANQTRWNGTLTSVPQSGHFAGSPAPANAIPQVWNGNNPDNMWASRALHPDVVDTFTLGNTTWMSYALVSNFTNNSNGFGCSLSIGKGVLGYGGTNNRGNTCYYADAPGGGAIGIGLTLSKIFTAGVWDPTTGALSGPTGATYSSTSIIPRIAIARIDWGDATTATTITQATFTDGDAITLDAFDNSPTR